WPVSLSYTALFRSRPAFVEADSQLIFEEELYSDFVALWLIVHASRLEPHDGSPASCILEQWLEQSRETGQRALSNLRDGVEQALRELGGGFLERSEERRVGKGGGW